MITTILPIGTKIENNRHGTGYILGNAHFRKNIYPQHAKKYPQLTYYLTYFPATQVRRYLPYIKNSTSHFKIIEQTSPENREIALSYLPAVVNTTDMIFTNKVPIGDANFYIGDIVKTNLFGQGIVLSDGFYRPDRTRPIIYHHIYFPAIGAFEFEQERYMIPIKQATDQSITEAKAIIRNQILIPAFEI